MRWSRSITPTIASCARTSAISRSASSTCSRSSATAWGSRQEDRFKRLKKLQDVELILAETRDLLAHHRVKEDAARQSIQAMIDEQPLPLTNLGLGDAPRPGGAPTDR